MPYQGGTRLPGERASKLGHMDVIHSELVNELLSEFTKPEIEFPVGIGQRWKTYQDDPMPLNLIFAVDGSFQIIQSDQRPQRELGFVKTALFRLDTPRLEKIDARAPHPLALRDIMRDSAIYHATVFPLKNLSIPGKTNYDAIRRIIYDSIKDSKIDGQAFETLKWLAYQKWTGTPTKSPNFECPHCEKQCDGLPPDNDEHPCEHCGAMVFLTDMLGFHLDMAEESAPGTIASLYMAVHETLLLFTGIRYFWERKEFGVLANSLFIKDGPLSLRAQYSKLVDPIRNFFEYTRKKNISIYVIGQEKSGAFFDHLQALAPHIEDRHYFVPDEAYIVSEVQHRPERQYAYGAKTNYGNKLFVRTERRNFLVLNVPVGLPKNQWSEQDMIGFQKIIGSLHSILSHKFEGALLPVELANGIASLSTYPSAKILKLFAGLD